MCGICGVVAFGRPPERATAERMAEALAHRGPDGSGGFEDAVGVALGHRRLAIIDLSDDGRQPFASGDGSLRLVYNGEIYNYRELREQLVALGRRFRTRTDTEVLLAAYEQWGPACVERFNGMWAFAIWDGARATLFCSRDRFGVKPFYYRFARGRLVFASELKAFRHDPEFAPVARAEAVRDFLEQGYVDHEDETFFAGVRQLPPAHSLFLDRHGLRLERHWSLLPRPAREDAVGALRELFVDAVRLRLRSDVPVGTALSGGLDSSAIACVIDELLRTEAENARPVGERQRTFTVWFDEPQLDEREHARAVAARIRSDARWISFSESELVDSLPAVVRAQDEPFASPSIVAQWHVMRAARGAGIKVMLDGQGGDEVLAGYPLTFPYRVADLVARGALAAAAAEVAARGRDLPPRSLLVQLATPFLPERLRWALRARRDGARALLAPELRALPPTPARTRSPFSERLRRQYHLILAERGLPELLRYEDRNSMAHSLEARVPFLDYRLVELAYSLGAAQLYARGLTKVALRRALADLLPPSVAARRDKIGFATPEARFFRGELGTLAEDVFASRSFAERGWHDVRAVRARLGRARGGDPVATAPLWRALSAELWARSLVDGG